MVKNLIAKMSETQVQSLGWEDPLEGKRTTHSSIRAWRTPWTEELGGLQSAGSQSQTRLSDLRFCYFIPRAVAAGVCVCVCVCGDDEMTLPTQLITAIPLQ